jgi:hypothetical protein
MTAVKSLSSLDFSLTISAFRVTVCCNVSFHHKHRSLPFIPYALDISHGGKKGKGIVTMQRTEHRLIFGFG